MEELKDLQYWENEWKKIFFKYQGDKRFAHYINAVLEDNERILLEIGAGSFRDMALLNQLGFQCYGCDFSLESVNNAKKYYPELEKMIIHANAFDLPFKDKFFDVSYHNGFWGCFSNDDIYLLMREQIRVTKNRLIIGVHNAHNKEFVNYFNEKQREDPLYSLRFFSVYEINDILLSNPLITKIKIIPVGKQKKYYEDYLINLGLGTRENLRKCFELHGMDLLEVSERLLCIAEIKKD